MGKELNWREVWEEKQKQRMKPLKIKKIEKLFIIRNSGVVKVKT